MELRNEELFEEPKEVVNVSNFILKLRKNLTDCTFENSYRLVDHVLMSVTKIKPANSKEFELELHENFILFKGTKNRWEELFYNNAEEYIENFIEENRYTNKPRRFKLLGRK